MKLRLLDAQAIAGLLTIDEAITAVAEAFVAYGKGLAQMPPKVYLEVEDGDFRAMPAALPALAGVKWVNVHPANAGGALPTVMGMMLVNDPATGQPLAVLDATLITRMRTGAAAAVATRALAKEGSDVVGLIGCGGQARWHVRALASVMTIRTLKLADTLATRAQALAAQLAQDLPQTQIQVVEISQACVADVVSTLTPSRTPYVQEEWIAPGTHINAMGADAPGKQELAAELVAHARVYVDDWTQASHSGEINMPVRSGALAAVAGTLPAVLCGKAAGRQSPQEITLFDSTGLAIQDLALAQKILEKAEQTKGGVQLDFDAGF